MRKGSRHSPESIEKNRIANSGFRNPMWGKVNDSSPNWKGEKACLGSIHAWVKRRKPKPVFCEYCNDNKAMELANLSGKYLRDVDDFMWLCCRCHARLDCRQIDQYRFKESACKKKRKPYGSKWKKQRRAALRRDEYRCRVCGVYQGNLKDPLIVHHKIPIKEGGTNNLDNLLCVCSHCHIRIEPRIKKKVVPVETEGREVSWG